MLKSFRNASNGVFIKILFGAIILSFVFWGIGDIVKNYSASSPVISVNDSSVTSDFFRMEYTKEKQNIRNSGDKPLSDEEMKKIDVKGIVLERTLNNLVLKEAFKENKIIVSRKNILSILESLPEFQEDGEFSPSLYAKLLQRSGVSEAGYVGNISSNLERNQLIHPLTSSYAIPSFIKEKILKSFYEEKTILISKIDVNDMTPEEEINEDDVEQHFNSNEDKYTIPESRTVSLLLIDYTKLGDELAVSDDDALSYYNDHRDEFEEKELRSFERFVFDSPEDAEKASSMMQLGKESKEIVRNYSPSFDKIDSMEKENFPEGLRDDLFNLAINSATKVYNVSGKYYVYRLLEIDKPESKTFLEAKEQIKESIRNEQMNSPEFSGKIRELNNKIEDYFGSGKSLQEVSKLTGMQSITLSKLDKNDKNQKELSKIIEDDQTREEIVSSIFESEKHQASTVIPSRETDTKAYVVYVDEISEKSVPKFKDIKEKVREDYVFSLKDKSAKKKLSKIIEDSNNPAKEVSSLKNTLSFKFSKKDVLYYSKEKNNKEITEMLKEIPNLNIIMNIISTLGKSEATYFKSDNQYVIVAVKDSVKPKYRDSEFDSSILQYIDTGVDRDMSVIVLNAFKSTYKIKIDEKLLESATKSSEDEENQQDQAQ